MQKLPDRLHIVSFDNPFPPNYGGVIDVFYKLKALHDIGVKITLHAFEYGRTPSRELNQFCDKVFYYQRRTFVNPFVGSVPYIVATRKDDELLKNLLADNAPILFEGLHTCFFLDHPELKERFKIVRMHNIEHDYYLKLEEVESNFFKKYFFSKESARLKTYQSVLHHANLILAISKNDETYLRSHFKHVELVWAFHSNENITSIEGKGDFALYHGKLSVGENDDAARFLVNHVFNDIDIPLFIAGNKPSSELRRAAEDKPHVKIFDHLSTEQITELIQKAHVNVLPTFQATGIKLKMINVLYQGRFVIANKTMVCNTGLEDLCLVADDANGFKTLLHATMQKDFAETDMVKRKEILNKNFNNHQNAMLLKQFIFKNF